MKLLLVDLGAIFWACWHASASKPMGFTKETTLGAVRQLAARADLTAIALDMPPYDRADIDKAYKANRAEPEAAAIAQLEETKAALADVYTTWGVRGCEADDIIATATRWARALPDPLYVVIVSGDKDLRQLVIDGAVACYDPRTRQMDDVASVEKRWGVRPEQLGDFLALVGDKADNIPGVMGIGDGHAGTLLRAHGTIDGILAALNSTVPDGEKGKTKPMLGPPSVRAALLGAVADGKLDVSRRLVALRFDAPIDCAEVLDRTPRARAAPPPVVPFDDGSFEGDRPASPPPPAPAMVSDEERLAAEERKPSRAASPRREDVETPAPPPEREEPTEIPAERAPVVVARAPSLAVLDPSDPRWALALQPGDAREAWAMAQHLQSSKLFEKKFASTAAIWTVILLGREHGLSALAALQSMHLIEGKVEMSADLIVAKVLRSGLARYFSLVESTDERATWETHRVGEAAPLRMSFTVQEAQRREIFKVEGGRRVSIWGKPSNWQKMPDVMCMWRAATKLARAKYPDVVRGLYGDGEIREMRNVIDVEGEAA